MGLGSLGCLVILVLIAAGAYFFRKPIASHLDLVPRQGAGKESATAPGPTGEQRDGTASLRLRITLDGSEQASSWDVFLFSPSGLERHDRLSSTSKVTLPDLVPGPKTLHVLPARYEDGVSSFTLPLLAKAGMAADILIPITRGKVIEGIVTNSRGIPQAFQLVQMVQLPIGLPHEVQIIDGGTGTLEQALTGSAFQAVEVSPSARLDRWSPIRIVAYDRLVIGAFTQANGTFVLKGVQPYWARVQASNGVELLWDDLVVEDGRKIVLSVPDRELVHDSNAKAVAFLQGQRFETFENELKRLSEALGAGRVDLLEAIEKDAKNESNPDRKAGLERALLVVRRSKKSN